MYRIFFLLILVVNSWSLVLEEKVEIGGFVELNSDASIWLRCESSNPCESNFKSETLAKVVSYKSPKMVIEFQDGTQAWLRATSDGFEGMYPTSFTSFPPKKDPALDSALAVENAIKAELEKGLLAKIAKCQTLKGPKFEGLGFGCNKLTVKKHLLRQGLSVRKVGEKRLALIAYKMEDQVFNVQLVFNANDRFSGIEYNFTHLNQRKFKKEVVPQLKWLAKVFSKPLGEAAETHPLKTRSLYEDQFKPYKVWKKNGFDIQVQFSKIDGKIGASGFIKNANLYLERTGGDVLNLDPKAATIVEDDFGDFEKSKSPKVNVGTTKAPDDYDDW